MRNFELIALTLSGLGDSSVAIAATRAGEIGVVDLQYVCERDIVPTLTSLIQHGRGSFGIRVGGDACEALARVNPELLASMKVVILTPDSVERLSRLCELLHGFHHRVLLEATCLEEAEIGMLAKVDGIIAKGHEAGGWVGDEPTFILLQRVLSQVSLPVWTHGGVGRHTVAACYAAGATGAVLDIQLALCRESSLPDGVKASLARMDGSETIVLGDGLGACFRSYARPGHPAMEALRLRARALEGDPRPREVLLTEWQKAVEERVGWDSTQDRVWPVGQDAAFAAPLARRFVTVGGLLQGLRREIARHVETAQRLRPLSEGAPLARSHGTRYPIVQGPMTRVSDRAAFAACVAEGGALSFLALALMRGHEVNALLEETGRLLGPRPWGVGILGFVPLEIRQEQLELIRAHHPPFALIAGGRPDQARSLEAEGIATYLHVPSPGLLRLFLDEGAKRFVFEGRECGGHVGPRTSFVLWEMMTEVLLEKLPPGPDSESYHVLFAAGVHDALSSAMVATLAAQLAQRGVRIGVLMGTAYLFTEEAVATGAIMKGFQEEAIRCRRTVLLETAPGHATRCINSPYVKAFRAEYSHLLREGKSADEIRDALEQLNLGRLRIASKGIMRISPEGSDSSASRYVQVPDETQRLEGMYMIGQVSVLRDRVCTIEELHREVALSGSDWLDKLSEPLILDSAPKRREEASDVAVIGMGCLLAKAPNLESYWANILGKVNAITEIPADRWDWRLYYDADPAVRDKIYSKWGGFLDEIPFDPVRYGIPPTALPSIEPLQLLTLEVVRAALEDAGYVDREFDREQTSVILGVGGGTGDLGQQYVFRSALPLYTKNEQLEAFSGLPEWTEDSFPGILLNVAAGRVANRFNLGGVNFTVDAACASSLAAIYLAVKDLEAGTSNMVIVGGADTVQNPFAYLCFSKTRALSPRGQCRTFDQGADGIVISEGLAAVVLKRLEDAERDGDRIYAVIKGVGGSSDGRDKGLTAPRPEGQIRALERAYAKAGFSLATVGLLEAHGTGTVAGDQAEGESLLRILAATGVTARSCAIGSVKSMIGHTKCTAGLAGLIKIALALYHKILPPTLNVEKPNPKVFYSDSPLYVNSEPRPWVKPTGHPRRAGVSAFGFGGTNFHAVLEEYAETAPQAWAHTPIRQWPAELFVWAGESRNEITARLDAIEQALALDARPELVDLAAAVWSQSQLHLQLGNARNVRLAIVATSLEDLRNKMADARRSWTNDPRGIYVGELSPETKGQLAFLFPGQGSQYPDMLRDLAMSFPEVLERFELADRVLASRFPKPLSAYVYPVPRFSQEDEKAAQDALTQTNVAQPALGAAGAAMLQLLGKFGVTAEMAAGHSYGEYVALHAAGVFGEHTLYGLSEARGRLIIEASAGRDLGTMAAVQTNAVDLREILSSIQGVSIANVNSPTQTVLSGSQEALAQVGALLSARGIGVRSLPVACAFHSSFVAPARDLFARYLQTIPFGEPRWDVYSNTTGMIHPRDPKLLWESLCDHLVRPVLFSQQIEAMYAAGARIFVEVGPRNVLVHLVREILGDRPFRAIATDIPGRDGRVQFQHALAELAVNGVAVDFSRLYRGRGNLALDLTSLETSRATQRLGSSIWMLNGARIRPINERKGHTPAPVAAKPAAPSTGGTSPKFEAREARQPRSEPRDTREVTAALPSGSGGSRMAPAHPGVMPGQADSVTPVSVGADSDPVMIQFQHLMSRFLDTQKQVMLAYLQRQVNIPQPATGTTPLTSPSADTLLAPAAVSASSEALLSSPSVTTQFQTGPAPALVAAIPDRRHLTEILVGIVSDRTGYSPEMLGLNQNLEADLGIDSIKRVEILGTFRRKFAGEQEQRLQGAMERLTKCRMLSEIIEVTLSVFEMASRSGQPTLSSSDPSVPSGSAPAKWVPTERALAQAGPVDSVLGSAPEPRAAEVSVPRFLLRTVPAPLEQEITPKVSGRLMLITDDERGVAEAVARLLAGRGAKVLRVSASAELKTLEEHRYGANLSDPAAAEALLDQIRQRHGPISGLLHLLPLRSPVSFDQMSLADWRDQIRTDVKSLFYLAKATASDLKSVGREGSGWCLAATALGGTFGSGNAACEASPHQGGLAGFLKTLTVEWPEVHCKVVDFAASDPVSVLASRILAEMGASDGLSEVRYAGGCRTTLQPYRAELELNSRGQIELDARSVILITGGARGITAQVALELAQRYRPILLLVGRTPFPSEPEPPETIGLTTPHALRSALIARLRRSEPALSPATVEAAYARLLREREIRATIAGIRAAGATVEYQQADIRHESAVRALVEDIYHRFGRLDGVISGAGLIEDKLVEDKHPDSLDRVIDTKADGAFNLSRAVRPETLGFFALFASVAGRFANQGQADYCAANEILNKLALVLDRRWPGRVVSLIWGPWEGVGMASLDVQRRFAERGIQLISPEEGRRVFIQELEQGVKGNVEVVLGDGPWGASSREPADAPGAVATESVGNGRFPLMANLSLSPGGGGRLEGIRVLDPDIDLYLNDHQIEGKPVLPFAMAVELMAEAVQQAWPEWQVMGLREVHLCKGVILENGLKPLRLVLRSSSVPYQERVGVDVTVEITDPDHPSLTYYRGVVELGDRLPEVHTDGVPRHDGLDPYPKTVQETYRDWLFHGPLFQCIEVIEGISADTIVARLRPSKPGDCVAKATQPWLIDPILVDSGPQLTILWARVIREITPLPVRLGRYLRYAAPVKWPIRCLVRVLPTSDGSSVRTNVFLINGDGHMIGLMEDLEAVGTKALNRVSGASYFHEVNS